MLEISMALAVIGIAMVSMLGLLGVGLNNTRDTVDSDACAMIAQSIVADRRATPFTQATPALSTTTYGIPALSATASFPYTIYLKKDIGTSPPVAGSAFTSMPGNYYQVDMSVNKLQVTNPNFVIFDIRMSYPCSIVGTNIGARTYQYFTTAIAKKTM